MTDDVAGALDRDPVPLSLSDARGRWVLAATVLGSGLAFLDATVVNVALPAIGREYDAGLGALAWTVNAYTLTLAALVLLGGSLGDRFGRRRVFSFGVTWFALASALCAVAPTIELLVAARALQGIGAALLTPGSLAIIQSSFAPDDRARAIGAWSGLGGIVGALAPFLGGWILGTASWRWIFLINLPLAAVVIVLARRFVPESRNPDAPRHTDVVGSVLVAAGLASLTFGLVTWPEQSLSHPTVAVSLLAGVVLLMAFLGWEQRGAEPMLPLGVFSSRQFTATNLVTFLVYAALAGIFFWLVLQLQVVRGFSPLAAGTALLPVTLLMLVLSTPAGRLGQRIGPRIPMTVGPILSAAGALAMLRVDADASYLFHVLPAVTLFGLGLSLTVAPLTSTVLAAVPDGQAGVASGVNNAVARVAALLAVAALPVATGLVGEGYTDPVLLDAAYRTATLVCAGLLLAGGALAAMLVRTPTRPPPPGAGRLDGHHPCCLGTDPVASRPPTAG